MHHRSCDSMQQGESQLPNSSAKASREPSSQTAHAGGKTRGKKEIEGRKKTKNRKNAERSVTHPQPSPKHSPTLWLVLNIHLHPASELQPLVPVLPCGGVHDGDFTASTPDLVSALPDVDFELALDEDLVSGLWELEDVRAAVDTAREREPLIVAAIDRLDVLPARWANPLLRLVVSAPLSAPRREGMGARVRSPPWPLEEPEVDDSGMDTEK
ncbi:hypothetical protein DFH08DRAFT_993284 [Mycena albidolilacea]|uniref:Uncharacterized protein n=1 Tax=Mycena albidolilacea TaxID=1033008 RepID=A0AAD7A815_9AGAR|nr:hypothetical protein DFH08DRAFT_993284 [Mycena albidolilacea]